MTKKNLVIKILLQALAIIGMECTGILLAFLSHLFFGTKLYLGFGTRLVCVILLVVIISVNTLVDLAGYESEYKEGREIHGR